MHALIQAAACVLALLDAFEPLVLLFFAFFLIVFFCSPGVYVHLGYTGLVYFQSVHLHGQND